MTDRDVGHSSRQISLNSLPMIARYGNLRMDDIPLERVLIGLKNPDNSVQVKQLKLEF